MDVEDYSVCTVCFDGSFSEWNPIVFCDECNVGVHRFCYGIGRVPKEEEMWRCDGCEWRRCHPESRRSAPQCAVCPLRGCALKQTADGGFVHVACALWVDGIEIADIRRMAPICGVLPVQEMQARSAMAMHAEMLRIGLSLESEQNADGDGLGAAMDGDGVEQHSICGSTWSSKMGR